MKKLSVFLLATSLSFLLMAQNGLSEALKKANSFYEIADYKQAEPYFQQVAAELEAAKNWTAFTKCIEQLSYCQRKSGNTNAALQTIEYAITVIQKNRQGSWEEALLWNAKANFFRQTSNFTACLGACQKAIALFENLKSLGDEPAFPWKTAGQIFIRFVDYPNAFRFYETAIRLDTGNVHLTSNRLNLSIAYYFAGNLKEAQRQANLGFANHPNPEQTADLQIAAAAPLEALGKFNEAEKLLLAALHFFQKEEDSESLKDIYDSLASIADKKNQPARAEQFFKKALAECRAAFPEKNRETAKTHVHFGEFLEKRGRFSEALAEYQQAIIQVFHAFNDPDPLKNPALEMAYVESFGMTAPAKKASLLLRMRNAEFGIRNSNSAFRIPHSAFLSSAAAAFDLAFACIRQLRDGYGDEAAKLELGEHVHNYLENALETRRLLFEMTGDEQHLARFFELMEENKASVLAEALRKNRAFEAAGIPDSLLEREIGLRRDLADTRANLQTTAPTDQKSIDEIKFKIAALERQQTALLARMTTQFPDFQRLATRRQPPSIADVLLKLQPGEALLEFFDGEKAVFLLLFFDGKTTIRHLEKADGLKADLAAFRRFFLDKSALEANPAQYFELASRLFQKICPLPDSVSRLLVVPDGQLAFLPFEALLTAPGWTGNFAGAPFLLKKTTVWQSWSTELWLHPLGWSGKKGGMKIQFAPIFANSERGMSPLFHSPDETQRAGFQLFTNEEAVAGQFFGLSNNPLAALHLSTHATADSLPRIEFFDRAVPLHEIFASRLRAELVVLSACETGIGQIERGEGLMSLARAFSYAGAASLVASLWKVNEQSTAQLFSHFYEKLAGGIPRSEALREAKIDFLKSDEMDARKSPFYWAGFVLIGEDGPLKTDGGGLPWPVSSLLFAVGLGLVWVFWKRKIRPGLNAD